MSLSDYLADARARQLDELCDWLRIPSISTLSEHRDDCRAAAAWLAAAMTKAGLEHVEVIEGEGNPLVYGDWLHAGDDQPTVLIYGHYDVQPVDPLDLWTSPPFEPTVRDGNLTPAVHRTTRARPSSMSRRWRRCWRERAAGQRQVHRGGRGGVGRAHHQRLRARARQARRRCLPCLRHGHPGAGPAGHHLRAARHVVVRGDGDRAGHGPAQRPLRRHGAQRQPGAGRAAGHAPRRGRPRQRARFLRRRAPAVRCGAGRDGQDSLSRRGTAPGDRRGRAYGEPEYNVVERIGARPTLEINGMWGGFTGEGGKTVIPSKAHAKISCRLVPDQDPAHRCGGDGGAPGACAKTISVEVTPRHGGVAFVAPWTRPPSKPQPGPMPRSSAWSRSTCAAAAASPSSPFSTTCWDAPVVLMGFGLPDDNLHAPNEKFLLANFYRGIATSAAFLHELTA
ncbi:MAG: peptidase dimerization domain-containing protein [Caldilineaceae bacterium]